MESNMERTTNTRNHLVLNTRKEWNRLWIVSDGGLGIIDDGLSHSTATASVNS